MRDQFDIVVTGAGLTLGRRAAVATFAVTGPITAKLSADKVRMVDQINRDPA